MDALLAISGSLRKGSLNTALARNARELVAADIGVRVETLHGVPLYDGDLEQAQGIPEAVERLKAAVREARGVVLVTPEYNNGIPGVFKNAIDWLSRPASGIGEVFGDRPFAVIGASPGGFGTTMAQAAWLPVLRTLGVRHWAGGRLMVRAQAESLTTRAGSPTSAYANSSRPSSRVSMRSPTTRLRRDRNRGLRGRGEVMTMPTPQDAKLDRIVAEARRNAEQRDQGYRERALKMYPWVCGRCAREFTRANLRELTVHHRNHNHADNPPDGSNWELLCVYCHDNEHSRQADYTGVSAQAAEDKPPAATSNPFAGLKSLLGKVPPQDG